MLLIKKKVFLTMKFCYLPYLQTNDLGCHFFINAHKRPNNWIRLKKKKKKAQIAQHRALSTVCTYSTCCTCSPGVN